MLRTFCERDLFHQKSFAILLVLNSVAKKCFAILLGLNSVAQICFAKLAGGTWAAKEVLGENAKREGVTREVLCGEFRW